VAAWFRWWYSERQWIERDIAAFRENGLDAHFVFDDALREREVLRSLWKRMVQTMLKCKEGDLLTIQEYAWLYGISPSCVQKAIEAGRIELRVRNGRNMILLTPDNVPTRTHEQLRNSKPKGKRREQPQPDQGILVQ